MLSLNSSYSSTFSYFLYKESNNFSLFQTTLGNSLRNGLCIVEAKRMDDIRIIKRGLPKVYEYTEKEDSPNFQFQNKLFKCISNLLSKQSVTSFSLLRIKIASEIHVQISFDIINSYWIISTKNSNCVIIKRKEEIEALSSNNTISNLMKEICLYWINKMTLYEKSNPELYKEFICECSSKTLIGFYCGYEESMIQYEEKHIIFYSFVYNMEKLSQFSASVLETDFFFQRYGLIYERSEVCKSNINSIEQFKEDLHNLYESISSDYLTYQQKGSLFLLLSNNKILTTFKILNNELNLLSTLKHSIEEDENIKNNKDIDQTKYKTLISKYKLPEAADFYLNIIPVITNRIKHNKTCIVTRKDFLDVFKNTSHPGFTTTFQSIISKKALDTTNVSNSLLLKLNGKLNLNESDNGRTDKSFHKQSTRDQSSKINMLENKANSGNTFLYDSTPKDCSGSPKRNNKVKFTDIDYKIPLIEIVNIESYKKYYLGNTYQENFNDKDKKKATCCIVF